MSTAAPLQSLSAKPQPLSNSAHAGLLLQRKCACGSPTASLTGECVECKSTKRLQTKLTIGASNDPLEQEADRVADQVLAAPANPAVSGAPPHIQRFTGQASASVGMAPASVDRAIAGSGRPLEPALRQDMEQRFGHNFSRVRVHSGAAAEQSARDVNANAYTVGQNIVFGAGRFAPGTNAGRRLIAHELVHTLQQRDAPPSASLRLTDPDAGAEAEALTDQTAGSRSVVRSQITAAVQRQPEDAGVADDVYVKQVNCLVLNGACYGGLRSAGIITPEEIAELNSFCQDKEGTGYEGPDIVPSDEECRQVMTGELVESAAVDQLEQLYLDTVDQLSSSSKTVDSEQIEVLNRALQLLRRAGREPVRTYRSEPVEAGEAGHAALGTAVAVGTTLTLGTGTLTGGGATGATIGATAAPLVAPALAVVGIALAGYGLYRLFEWASRDAKVDPQAAARVQQSVDELMRLQTRQPEPAPVPVGPSPAPLPDKQPDDDPRRRRKCQYPTGFTRVDPIPIIWFKPRIDNFYPRYISLMDAGPLDRDDPGAALPDGTPVGVQEAFWPKKGKVVQLVPERRGGKEREFKKALTLYGYDWKAEGTSPDHVQDLQWGGPDAFGNFWPMDRIANSSAGPTQNQWQKVTFCQNERGPLRWNKTIQWVKDNGKAIRAYGRFFEIKDVRIAPPAEEGEPA